MSEIRPFKGLRPKVDLVQKVASPPYDVLTSQEAREMAKDNPLSFLHVVKAEIDLNPETDPHSHEAYKKGTENFKKFINKGIFIQDEFPCFYIYQLIMGDHRQRGLVVGTSIDEYEKGLIKKHEFTRRNKEDDRARHVNILNANTGPVMMSYKATPRIDKIIDGICSFCEPVYNFVAEDAVEHVLWVVSKPDDIETIQKLFKGVNALYIADGHHRSAAAFRVRDIRRKQNPNHKGNEAYDYFLAVVFPDNQLKIMGYNRAVKDLGGLSFEGFIDKVRECFNISETDNPLPPRPHHFTMFLKGKWYSLVAKEGTYPADDPVLSLDVSILQNNLLEPILEIQDVRTNNRIDFIGGIRGTKELEKRCSENMEVAFALYPTSLEQLMIVADKGQVMPPKSTWFEPKLRSGIVIRSLE